jgi:hypothetical protein
MTVRQPDTSRRDSRAGWVTTDGWLLLAILCFVAGAITLIVTWYKISGLALVAEQLPYLASGGLGGLALVIAGAGCLSAGRSARIEARLIDLLSVATEPVSAATTDEIGPAGDAGNTAGDASDAAGDAATTDRIGPAAPDLDGDVLTVTGGTTYHRSGCRLIAGKQTGSVSLRNALASGLTACPVCH